MTVCLAVQVIAHGWGSRNFHLPSCLNTPRNDLIARKVARRAVVPVCATTAISVIGIRLNERPLMRG